MFTFSNLKGNGYGLTRGFLNDLWRWNPKKSQWTWIRLLFLLFNIKNISGSASPNGGNVTGSSWANTPSARSSMLQWKTSTGDVYIFGGLVALGPTNGSSSTNEFPSPNFLVPANDLWKWTEMSGWSYISTTFSITIDLPIDAQGNKPKPRYRGATWIDSTTLYFYGGNDGNNNFYADMWGYIIGTNSWSFKGGFGNNTNILPHYPATLGTFSLPIGIYNVGVTCSGGSCHAGSRSGVASFTDSNGQFWMFGGDIYIGSGTTFANDLWRIEVVYGGINWTQVAGSQSANVPGDYSNSGTKTIFELFFYS
jgi:hypothetical protein